MRVMLQYGSSGLPVDLPDARIDVIAPKHVAGLPDERAAFVEAVRTPLGAGPLRTLIHDGERVAVAIPDVTRAFPSHRVLPWLFAELPHVRATDVTILIGTGSHRPASPDEIRRLVGSEIAARYRVINHTAHDATTLQAVGQSLDGRDVTLNRQYVAADRRLVLGFIEPHFMAGFSGGYKGAFPALAGIDAIMHYHRAAVIGHRRSTWGMLDGNPTQDQIRHNGSLVPIDFLINVTLNRRQDITGFFCGEVAAAHARGAAFARETAMVACGQPYPIVITTNSGAPLDQNLYQSVKGMCAATQIVAEGGLVVMAARCQDGFPAHGNFRTLVQSHTSPRALLETILQEGFAMFDQWQAQLFALALLKSRIAIYSELPALEVARAHLEPITDIAACVVDELARIGQDARIAVLPEGPMTIPYLA
jgi:nickel-dependent lactate racemase